MAARLVGTNYITPDIVAKATGLAKYAEDFRADGMLFCKLMLSERPHARILGIDTSRALALDGVRAILTPDDVPQLGGTTEHCLTREPLYAGEPILAVAAISEEVAAAAIELIELDIEALPHNVDPIDSLRPGRPSARLDGNVWGPPSGEPPRPRVQQLTWTDEDFAAAGDGQLPTGKAMEEWVYGDVDGQFARADLIVDETFVVPSTGHHPMETRSAMAQWRNGKLHLHASTQSVVRTVDNVARWVGVPREDVVLISEYTGGGFGSKGGGSVTMAIPALLARKANAPVMMRISREEESYIGRARTNMVGRVKAGFAHDGRILALDMFIVQDSGPYGPMGDHRSAGNAASLIYQPVAMRWRAVNVITNTPPRSQQRSPGPMQANGICEGVLTKAARQLGIDQVAIRRLNSPEGRAEYGAPGEGGRRRRITSAFVKEALDRGVEEFDWHARAARSGQRRGTKVTGVGVAVGPHGAGSIGFDGLMTIRTDGKLYVQSGVGNFGAHSVMDLARVAADVLEMPWDQVVVNWGDTSQGLPWTCSSVGSQTTHAMTRANHAAASDAKQKLQEIAAREFGGMPDAYTVAGQRVFRTGRPGVGLTFAQAAERAITLGGAFDGHTLPEDIHAVTTAAARLHVGTGVMGVAKDVYPRQGDTYSFVAAFAEVEVDIELGSVSLVRFHSVGDVGTVVNPRSLVAQLNGGCCLGIAHAMYQKLVYDTHYGLSLARRFHQNKPMTLLDIPRMTASALDIADPETPVGARGVGEPPVGAGFGAVLNAIADAVGVDAFRRAPVTADVLLMSLSQGRRMHEPLRSHL